MSGLQLRPTLNSFFTLLTTAFFAVFLFASQASAATDPILIVPDVVFGQGFGNPEVMKDESLKAFIFELEKQGYTQGENLEVFSYDTDQSIVDIAGALDQALETLKTAESADVQIVGYGVGGLITRQYIGSEAYDNDISKVVFVATPHRGTLQYLTLEYDFLFDGTHSFEDYYWMKKNFFESGEVDFRADNFSDLYQKQTLLKQIVPETIQGSYIPTLETLDTKGVDMLNLRFRGDVDGITRATPWGVHDQSYHSGRGNRSYQLSDGRWVNYDETHGNGVTGYSYSNFPQANQFDYFHTNHEYAIAKGLQTIIHYLGLDNSEIPNLVKGKWDDGNFQYPEREHQLSFFVGGVSQVELTDNTGGQSTLTNAAGTSHVKTEGDKYTWSKIYDGFSLASEGDYTISVTSTFTGEMKLHAVFSDHHSTQRVVTVSFPVVEGETVTYRLDLNLSNRQSNWHDRYRRITRVNATWTELNRIVPEEDYPIILVHGILGGWNPEMMGLDGKEFKFLGGVRRQIFLGEEWIELDEDSNWQRIRGALRANKQYYQFFYDWRQSNEASGEKLDEYISFVKEDSGSEKVQILAHSMGGLVTRSYIQSDQYDQDIAKIVMAGTPNHGATSSIPKWYYGDMSGTGKEKPLVGKYTSALFNWILTEWHPFLDKDLSNDDKRNVIRGLFEANNVPGVLSLEELLPTYYSLKVFFGTEGFGTSIFEPTPNPFLNNLNQDISSLYDHDILFVVGNQEGNTPREYHIRKNDKDEIVRYGGYNAFESGDGTVLIDSLLLPCENGRNLVGDDGICRNESGGVWSRQDIESGHLGIPSNDCEEILQFLNHDQSLCESQPYSTETAQPVNNDSQRFDSIGFSIASPVDIEVVTPSGKVFNKFTNEEEYFKNNAFYLSLGEEGKKIIMLPYEEQGEYQVNLTAVGNGGEYDVITWLETDVQSLDISNSGEISPDQKKEYLVTVEENEEGIVEEGSLRPLEVNNPPTAILDKEAYEGVEGQEITFDASSSSDEDGDDLQFKWTIADTEGNEIISTEFSDNSSHTYTFENSFTGDITLTVTDGEFEDSVSTEVSVRALTFQEKVSQIRGLLESIEEDTSYIQAKKRLWLRLIDILELPQVENNDRLQSIIIRILERDIERSLWIDKRFERTWMWWRRVDLISDENEEILVLIINKLEKI